MSKVTAKESLYKQPNEVRKYTMDFENILAGYYVTGIILAESTPVGLSISSTGIGSDNQSVEMIISSGTDDTDYYVAVRLTTTNSETLEGDGILLVRET